MQRVNFNGLPHAIPYISTQFSMVLSYLERITMRCHQFYKKIYINIKKNPDGNAW